MTRTIAKFALASIFVALLCHLSLAQTTQKAGSVTGVLPDAKSIRGGMKTSTPLDIKKGDTVQWNDLLSTETNGRLRVTLDDQSILSLGSKSQLRVVKHDAKSQQTALTLAYGRVRAEVSAITRDGGSFEIRTPTAVAGVVGTEFSVDVNEKGETTVTCLKGKVKVKNADPKIKGEESVSEGHVTSVKHGAKPEKPHPLPSGTIEKIKSDTEVSETKKNEEAAGTSGETGNASGGAGAADGKSKDGKEKAADANRSADSTSQDSDKSKSTTKKTSTPAKKTTPTAKKKN